MRFKLLPLLFLLLVLTSCKGELYEERIKKNQLKEGEYYSELDSQNGFSVRGNKIAFFEKMEFGSDDIYEYKIIDSVLIKGKSEKLISTYLIRTDQQDTLYTAVEKMLDSTIVLINNNQSETFRLKTRIQFKN